MQLKDALERLDYEPLLIKDIPDFPSYDLPQKVVAVGTISRFIVVDDSSKSGHLLEVELCNQNRWVTILLRADGKGGSWMTAGAAASSNVILEIPYSLNAIHLAVAEAAQWAESKLKILEQHNNTTYPWRVKGS